MDFELAAEQVATLWPNRCRKQQQQLSSDDDNNKPTKPCRYQQLGRALRAVHMHVRIQRASPHPAPMFCREPSRGFLYFHVPLRGSGGDRFCRQYQASYQNPTREGGAV